jgi:hypothetical protein
MTTDLEQRLRELSEEIRNYPGPIARCDEQLTVLIEQRARLLSQINSQETGGCSPAAIWINDGGFNAA